MIQMLHGDCLEVLRGMPDNSVESIVTDPPYGLSFMGKRWDYDVPSVEIWAECLRVLKPGGYLLAFAGTRTQHRMAVRIEDAGFEIRDMVLDAVASDTHAQRFMASLNDEQQRAFAQVIAESNFGGMLAWVYGSGFPKSLDVSKAIDEKAFRDWLAAHPDQFARLSEADDESRVTIEAELRRAAGAERQFTPVGNAVKRMIPGADQNTTGSWIKDNGREFQPGISEPATDAARQWQGWGTALKPALEPITVARKPLIGTVAENVLRHGTGAINIDGCRVEGPGGMKWETPRGGIWTTDSDAAARLVQSEQGRFPANLIHDGSDEVVALFPDSNGAGGSVPNVKVTGYGDGIGTGKSEYLGGERTKVDSGSGSAARFFYCAKASKKDRGEGNNHPTVKPTDLMRYLCRLVTPPGGTVLDPFAGSGSTGKACAREGLRFIGIEREAAYVEIAQARTDAELVEGLV